MTCPNCGSTLHERCCARCGSRLKGKRLVSGFWFCTRRCEASQYAEDRSSSGQEASAKRRPGRPSLASSGRTSVYVHASSAEVAEWKRAAKRADMTLNGWLVSLARAAVERKDSSP